MKYRLMSLVSIIFGTMLLISFAADLVVFYDSLVIFDTMGAAELEPLKVESGDTVSLPTPQREGYTFGGWSEVGNPTFWTNGQLMPNRNVRINAVLTLVTYNITYNGNGITTLPTGLPTTYNIT